MQYIGLDRCVFSRGYRIEGDVVEQITRNAEAPLEEGGLDVRVFWRGRSAPRLLVRA